MLARISSHSVAVMERGDSAVGIEDAVKSCCALNCSVEYLLTGEMGQYLYLDSGTLTPLLKKLEAKGLITQTRSTHDERNLNISITDAGEGLKDRAVAVPVRIAQCSRLEPEEAVALYRILYKILGREI